MTKPEKRFKCGCCEAAIFENDIARNGAPVKVKKVSFQKRYKDKDGEWKTTYSLDINDLPKAILVLQSTYKFLLLDEINSEENETMVAKHGNEN